MKLRVAIVLVVLVAVAPGFVSSTCLAVVRAGLDAISQLLGAGNA